MGNKNRNAFVSVFAAAAITIPAIGSAAAPSHADDVSVTVSYADLDIDSKAGAKVLYLRLKRASEAVCDIQPHVIKVSLANTRKARACLRETLQASVEKIDSDALSAVHAS